MNSWVAQRHDLVAAGPFDPIILALEGDAVSSADDQAAIGDGDAVGVAREIAQHLPRVRRTASWRRPPTRLLRSGAR